jgi:8-oxo-dGTP pyrophosphatase MutT (NUDIX family)
MPLHAAIRIHKAAHVAKPPREDVRRPSEHKIRPTLTSYDAKPAALAASLVIIASDTGRALFIQRGPDGDYPGTWCTPGGHIDEDEEPIEAAVREAREEVGYDGPDPAEHQAEPEFVTHVYNDEVDLTLFVVHVDHEFVPKLNNESTAFAWAPVDRPPLPARMSDWIEEIVPELERLDTALDEKVTKARAQYTDNGGLLPCKLCTMFRKPDRCTAVAGKISPLGHCRFYRPKFNAAPIDDAALDAKRHNGSFIAHDAEWNEGDHPRDDGGQFTSGGGSAGHTYTKKDAKQASSDIEHLSEWLQETYGTNADRSAYLDKIDDPDIERLHSVLADWEPDDTDPNFPVNRGPLKALRDFDTDYDLESLDWDRSDERMANELRTLGRGIKPPGDVKADSIDLYRAIEGITGLQWEDLIPEELEASFAPFNKKIDKLYDELGAEPWMRIDQLDDIKADLGKLKGKVQAFVEAAREREKADDPDFKPDDYYVDGEQFLEKLNEFGDTLDYTREAVIEQEAELDAMSKLYVYGAGERDAD